MKTHWAVILALLLPLWSHAADPAVADGERVFVCAHSFMIFVAEKLPPMAQAAGIHYVAAGRQGLASSRVLAQWELPAEKNPAKAALEAGNVDAFLVSPYLQVPDEGIDKFTQLGLGKNPKLRVLVQASWPAFDGMMAEHIENAQHDAATVESLKILRAGQRTLWLHPLEEQVRRLNASAGHDAVFIVPACDAVFALREKLLTGKAPGLVKQSDLFRDGIGHPQPVLEELVTYCHFAAIFRRSPEGLPVPGDLKNQPQAAELNRLLQQLAWEAVTNYPMSGVKAPSPASAGAR